jgi:hypothetical protein
MVFSVHFRRVRKTALRAVVGSAIGRLPFAAVEAGIVVYLYPPRSRGTRDQHPLVRLSSVPSALGIPIPAAKSFEVPSHPSPPFAARAIALLLQTSEWETELRSCSPKESFRGGSLEGLVYSMRLDINCSRPKVSARKRRSAAQVWKVVQVSRSKAQN